MYYCDRDLLVATQIAYYSFDKDVLNHYRYKAPLRLLLKSDPTVKKRLLRRLETGTKRDEPFAIYRARRALELYDEIISEESIYGDWIIRYIRDMNPVTGFYGCLIETSKESAIIGFRGSESSSFRQIKEDWIDADFGLLRSKLTKQQAEATTLMYEIDQKFSYTTYAATGHSLGGNLTLHGAITAPWSMRVKIKQCISFDGPGYSKKYIAAHQEEIDHYPEKLIHYQWSLVGALLFNIAGANNESICTKIEVFGKGKLNFLFEKHDTCFVLFDNNCNVIPGRSDCFSIIMKVVSRIIDQLPQLPKRIKTYERNQ